MNIATSLAGALALLATAVPAVAAAQQQGEYPYSTSPQSGQGEYTNPQWQGESPYQTSPQWQGESPYPTSPGYQTPESSVTPLAIVPPASASVFVYRGHRLLARLDGPGVLWVPTGSTYRLVAMRSDQVIWSGSRAASGATVEVRWPAPPGYSQGQGACPYAYPRGPLTAPVERGRVRTPLQ